MTLCSDWTDQAAVEACYDIPDGTAQAIIDDSITAASELLYVLTGRQFPGTCTETIRPCGTDSNPTLGFPWVPMRSGDTWVNTGACGCNMRTCGCDPYPSVNLGRGDIQSVTTVKVDGATLDAGDYRLDTHRYLTRLDGEAWPCCQDLTKADTETNTWSVALTYGYAVPQALQTAAANLATELVKACVGADCRLPQRTQTITRQGVTIGLLDPFDFLTEGKTGLYEVDLAITAYNPNGLRRRATAWSPEIDGGALRSG